VAAQQIRDGWLATLPAQRVLAGLRDLARGDSEWADYDTQPKQEDQ
jgi:hypothetical protein